MASGAVALFAVAGWGTVAARRPRPGDPGTLGLGEPCGDSIQCSSGSGTPTTCDDNGIDFGGICCTFNGFRCFSDRHCCGDLLCLDGICEDLFSLPVVG